MPSKSGFDDTDKGLSRPQPLQAVGFDDTDKGLSQPQPLQAVGFDDIGKSDHNLTRGLKHEIYK